MSTRIQIAQGFAIVGTVGLLVAAFVVPSQWQSGNVRVEAQIGLAVSTLCVLFAAAAARDVLFGLKVLLSTLLMASLGYLAVVPFAIAQAGWNNRAVALAFGLIGTASVSAAALWRFRRAAQQIAARDAGNPRA